METKILEQLLTGTHVRVWPYAPGLYSPHLLPALWKLLADSPDLPKVFWNNPQIAAMVVTDFLKLIENILLLIVQDRATEEIAGLGWFDNILWRHRASLTVWYRREYWGIAAREGTRIMLDYGFQAHGWHSIWAYTPWHTAVRHGEAIGAKVVAMLPGYACIHGKARDVYVLKKDACDGREIGGSNHY